MQSLTGEKLAEALETCASEKVHIPGIIQPFATLIAVDVETGNILYASHNTCGSLGVPCAELLGRPIFDIVDNAMWHEVKNALSRQEIRTQAVRLGEFTVNGLLQTVHAFESAGHAVLEFERHQETVFSGAESLRTLRMFMEHLETAQDSDDLFQLSTELFRHFTGYDRVMIYRFDDQFNGEILAEARRSTMQSFVGLRFPHWDIPAQARAMMEKIPLRFIEDVDQDPVRIEACSDNMPPLDISLATSRGVSTVHMEYLRNMGIRSTMTLTIKLAGRLWGIISFHHQRPRVPAAILREILVSVAQVFSTKLEILQQQERLALVTSVDTWKDDMLLASDSDEGMQNFLSAIRKSLGADGVLITRNDIDIRQGTVPEHEVIVALKERAAQHTGVHSHTALEADFPSQSHALNGIAGALVQGPDEDQCLLVFRKAIEQKVQWAGNPEKTTERIDDRLRISPRGSFATYLETVKGQAKPWSDQDLYLSSRIWVIINTIERRELISSLNRQQKIMIDELHHRVRNLLAMVRAVSRQAQQSNYGSLDSYSRALEARINALAASHELASKSVVDVVAVEELIETEFRPFRKDGDNRFTISGRGPRLRAEVAPIFSLVVHELVTNAVKYGALSTDAGKITVTLTENDTGLAVEWKETGGPPVVAPNARGFGSTLILEAVPYELDGDCRLEFPPDGVYARIFLPRKLFDIKTPDTLKQIDVSAPRPTDDEAFLHAMKTSTCLIVEDNFMIARTARDDLMSFGLKTCDIAGSVESALDILKSDMPSFAILDINLGQGGSSLPVAEALQKAGVPFLFVSGYGADRTLPAAFQSVIRLTKPVLSQDLRNAVAQIIRH